MKFLHMADVHLGGWRDESLASLGIAAFAAAIDEALKHAVDFVIIAGDLYNTAVPAIDWIKASVIQLKRLQSANIPVYIIPGSHDYSPSGKTMLDVLEGAGLVKNVVRGKEHEGKLHLSFTIDKKTGAKLTGMLGKKNMLERSYYEALDHASLEQEKGFKIFLFHTALDELKPDDLGNMESNPISLLPKGFDYYAGGHVHIVAHTSLPGYNHVVYPGPTFPNSFSELEKLMHGGYYLYDDTSSEKSSSNSPKISYHPLLLKPVQKISIDCSGLSIEEVERKLRDEIKILQQQQKVSDALLLIRLSGTLKSGKTTDLPFAELFHIVREDGAYAVLKNTNALHASEFAEIVRECKPDTIEQEVIDEHIGQISVAGWDTEHEKAMMHTLLQALSAEKAEGETNTTYEQRLLADINLLQ